MGFLASELKTVLTEHATSPNESEWVILFRMGIHPSQVERLQQAAEDFGQVATLPSHAIQQLRQELALSPIEYARLQAGVVADAFFHLMVYHNYPLEEAANKSNAVFANALKDKLATGGKSESVYPTIIHNPASSAPTPAPKKRGPGRPKAPHINSGSAAAVVPTEAQ